MRLTSRSGGWPLYGWLGLGLTIVFWTLNWSLSGLRSHWCFFPLWLGYCLTVDALVRVRKGDSLLTRNAAAYVGLFIASIPGWWLFELINNRTQNWFYEGAQQFTDLQYFALASLSFSTVMPAVFGTAELMSTFGWTRRTRRGPLILPRPATLLTFLFSGCLMLALLLLWPHEARWPGTCPSHRSQHDPGNHPRALRPVSWLAYQNQVSYFTAILRKPPPQRRLAPGASQAQDHTAGCPVSS